jgi:photosystem II stability/assembly factor-like uncharacterized protein
MINNQHFTRKENSMIGKIHQVLIVFFLLLVLFNLHTIAKEKPSTPEERLAAFQQRTEMAENSLFKNLSFRSVGPVVMSGRVVDIEPHPNEPYTFFVAYATGGLWKTTSNGMGFQSLFDNQNAISIGDIAIDAKNPNIIWVGTGENNSSRSSYSGTGIYKTTDEGKNWQFMGLGDSHHIGRIVIHPDNSDIVYIAALGHLYTENEERGIYRTNDGGKTWEKVLYINPRTGCVDLVMNPKNPNVLYAAAWEKDRKAWDFTEGGTGSGIYKSTNGGDNWELLGGGFPQAEYIGRIGLAVYPKNPNIVYALVDNQQARPEEDQKKETPITARKLLKMSKQDILGLTDDDLKSFLRQYGFHSDYTTKIIRDKLTNGDITPQDFIDFINKNNPRAFDPIIIGAEVYRSNDAGKTWGKTNEDYLDSFYSTYGYYFGEIRVAPDDENKIYILGVPLLTSNDGGKNFEWLGGKDVHGDHQAFWIDPNFPNHLIDGNDGGLNISYDAGENWWKLNYVPVGQFYTVNVDMAEPYNIYGGLQDNGVYKGSSRSKPGKSQWERIYGGDGMYVQIDPEDFTIYTGYQFGNYARINPKTKKPTRITPRPHLNDPGLRYNWQTPILLSSHSRNVLYFGSNRLYRSFNRGDSWQPISSDLTTNPDTVGDVPYATITTISESKITFGLIYIGTDDGRIWVTKNSGYDWTEIGKNLPQGLWCSRVEASSFEERTAFVSLNGYRNDDFRTYIYRTKDIGNTWESIKSNMPDEAVNVIREDPYNPHVLYVGTDMGVFVTLDEAKSWDVLQTDIPISPAHDMVIHQRDHDLVVGTHGRSIYVMNIKPIQELTPSVMRKNIFLFDIEEVKEESRWSRKPRFWSRPDDPTVLEIFYWLAEGGKTQFTIKDKKGNVLRQIKHEGNRGINTLKWDLILDRETALKLQNKEAQKKVTAALKKLDNVKKSKKSDIELAKIAGDFKRATQKLETIQETITDFQKYKHLPEELLSKKVARVYVSKGEYEIELAFGKETVSKTLKVTAAKKARSSSPEDRNLNKKWEQEKRRKRIKNEYQ